MIRIFLLLFAAASLEAIEWPNTESKANSDQWIADNHDRITKMRPKVLVINFANKTPREKLDGMVADIIKAVKEGSRYHGYKTNSPAFLEYEVFKFVDLREAEMAAPNSSKVPYKPGVTNTFNIEYSKFFSREFAEYYGVETEPGSKKYLDLAELMERGMVHEVWMMGDHDDNLKAYESVELKPKYDESFKKIPGEYVQAGNGGDDQQRWTGRSVRIAFVNVTRGIGCFMESLSHSIEGMANSKAIPYFTRYFHEFAGHDLDKRFHGFPWFSFYPLWGKDCGIEYPNPTNAIVTFRGKKWELTNYVAIGGNVHFPPNGRAHYDLENKEPVMSTIEDWRIGSGPGGKDIAKPWTNEAFAQYRKMAPDCMGPWLVYWRQNFPGLNNRQKDDFGKPMKNWWPFLFY